MREETIETTAETLEEASESAKSKIPDGFCCLSEKVICDGKPLSVKGAGDSVASAFAKAMEVVSQSADIASRKELRQPCKSSIELTAFDDHEAKVLAEKKVEFSKVTEMKIKVKGKSGIFGIGRRPSIYEVNLDCLAIVELAFKPKARISLQVVPIKSMILDTLSRLEEAILYVMSMSESLIRAFAQKEIGLKEFAAGLADAQGHFEMKGSLTMRLPSLLEDAKKLFPGDRNIGAAQLPTLKVDAGMDLNLLHVNINRAKVTLDAIRHFMKLIERQKDPGVGHYVKRPEWQLL